MRGAPNADTAALLGALDASGAWPLAVLRFSLVHPLGAAASAREAVGCCGVVGAVAGAGVDWVYVAALLRSSKLRVVRGAVWG